METNESLNKLGNSILGLAKWHYKRLKAEFDSKPIGSKELFEEEKLKQLEAEIENLERTVLE